MAKKSDNTKLIYNDFEKLFQSDLIKEQKRNSKFIENDFEKLIQKELAYEKTTAFKARKKVSESNSKNKKIISTRKTKRKVSIPKQDLSYEAFQKSFMLPAPIKITKKLMDGLNFTEYLHNNFFNLVKDFFTDSKNFTKKSYTLATVGYHFYFIGNGEKIYQSGFRKPRIHLTENNITKVINELFMQTFERFEVYFKTKNKSQLYFEGMTAEVSFDTKSKRK